MGSAGAIGTTYNILPGHFAKLYNAFAEGNLDEAQTRQYQANRVIKAFTSVPSISAIKEILARMGFDCGVPRRPLRPLTTGESKKLWQMLDQTEFNQLADTSLSAGR